ncbi:MAG TPA: hypothetical protein VJZ91_12285 [Blastocatellia bacterium]|nr:hypothetical protein [Blastocatellia bacterium]
MGKAGGGFDSKAALNTAISLLSSPAASGTKIDKENASHNVHA